MSGKGSTESFLFFCNYQKTSLTHENARSKFELDVTFSKNEKFSPSLYAGIVMHLRFSKRHTGNNFKHHK